MIPLATGFMIWASVAGLLLAVARLDAPHEATFVAVKRSFRNIWLPAREEGPFEDLIEILPAVDRSAT